MPAAYRCRICFEDRIDIILDAGLQPLSNRYIENSSAAQYLHPFVMGQCTACGVIQLLHPVPAEKIACRFPWLKYTEPEAHLDSLGRIIRDLPGLPEDVTVCGITYKDDTLLSRLGRSGKIRTWRIDPQGDLGLDAGGAAGETVLPLLTSHLAGSLVKKHGKADVVVCRHVYEHASDVHGLLESLSILLNPGGWIVFEVPDCTAALESKDYSMPWEEHLLYFTEATLRNSFSHGRLELMELIRYPYPGEDALIAITRKGHESEKKPMAPVVLNSEIMRATGYGRDFEAHRNSVKRYLKSIQEKRGKISVYGAGHQSCMFINLMGIKDMILCVVDDNPHKHGYFMPGSGLPIVDSSALMQQDITLCLLGVNMAHEAKVIERNRQFIDRGGQFVSIFPASERCFKFEP